MGSFGRFLRRFGIAVVVVSVLMVGTVKAVDRVAASKLDNVAKAEIPKGTLNKRPEGRDPVTFLIIGSDTREGLDDTEAFGTIKQAGAGQRADTIMLARVDPKKKTGYVVSIPRDSWVKQPNGGMDRINAAYNLGAPGIIRAVRENFNVDVHHYMEVKFNGVENIVNAVGGVGVFFYFPARDRFSGLNIPNGGCYHMDGSQALAYSRSRHYEEYVEGRWKDSPDGDFGRIHRQQNLMRRLAKAATGKVGSNPFDGNSIVNTVLGNLTIDRTLTSRDLIQLAETLRSADADKVVFTTLPTNYANIAGKSVLTWTSQEVAPVLAPLFGNDLTEQGAGDVSVRVLNGTSGARTASTTAKALREAGFKIAGVANADRRDVATTEIHYLAGKIAEAKAKVLSAAIAGPVSVGPVFALSKPGADVELIIGSDFGGVKGATEGSAASESGQAIAVGLLGALAPSPRAATPPTLPKTPPPVEPDCE